jgi:choice-of-anchor B domain-containing protein
MQVFDLTRLRNVANPPEVFTTDALYNGFGSAHNIAINEDSGYAYSLGTSTFSGGPHFVNIQDPLNPVSEGGYAADGYCHDAQIVIYEGPDADYTGREIFIGSNANEVVIEDVTDKSNPVTISTVNYNNVNYTHQGWLTDDHRYFLLGDETDELNLGINSRTIIFDFEDLDDPQLSFEYSGPTGATDHNGYVNGNKFYLANNAAGLRVIDIADIANQNINEFGFFDSYSSNNNAGFNGSWSIYPFFESGHIVISDRAQGFLLVKAPILGIDDINTDTRFTIFPNPAWNTINISSNQIPITSIAISDVSGKLVYSEDFIETDSKTFDFSSFAKGTYLVLINNIVNKKIIKE